MPGQALAQDVRKENGILQGLHKHVACNYSLVQSSYDDAISYQ
jgi:hypothetical protein